MRTPLSEANCLDAIILEPCNVDTFGFWFARPCFCSWYTGGLTLFFVNALQLFDRIWAKQHVKSPNVHVAVVPYQDLAPHKTTRRNFHGAERRAEREGDGGF